MVLGGEPRRGARPPPPASPLPARRRRRRRRPLPVRKPAWKQADTDALLRAWEAVVPAPRAREMTPSELGEVFRSFRSAIGASRCPTAEAVQRIVRQVVATFEFISAADERSQRRVGKGWFDLPGADRARRLDALPADSLVIKGVSRDFFKEISRLCSNGSVADSRMSAAGQSEEVEDSPGAEVKQAGSAPTDGVPDNDAAISQALIVEDAVGSTEASIQSAGDEGAADAGDEDQGDRDNDATNDAVSDPLFPSPNWGTFDDVFRFLLSWDDAVDAFLKYGNTSHESVKLPSWLIHQYWIRYGGSSELSVDLVTNTKRWFIMAFQAVCTHLSELLDGEEDSESSPNWFSRTFDERFKDICDGDIPMEAKTIAATINESHFAQIAKTLKKEAVLSKVTPPTQENGQIDDDDSYLSPSIEAEITLRNQQPVMVSRRTTFPDRRRAAPPMLSAPIPSATSSAENRDQPPSGDPDATAGVIHAYHQAAKKRPVLPPLAWSRSEVGPSDCANEFSLEAMLYGYALESKEPERSLPRVHEDPTGSARVYHQATRKRPLLSSASRGGGEAGSSDGANEYLPETTACECVPESAEPERPLQRLRVDSREHSESRSIKEQKILELLDQSVRNFDELMRSARAEREQEYQQHRHFLLTAGRLRCSPPMDAARSAYLKELALLRNQQLMVKFLELHCDHEQDRGRQWNLLVDAARGHLGSR